MGEASRDFTGWKSIFIPLRWDWLRTINIDLRETWGARKEIRTRRGWEILSKAFPTPFFPLSISCTEIEPSSWRSIPSNFYSNLYYWFSSHSPLRSDPPGENRINYLNRQEIKILSLHKMHLFKIKDNTIRWKIRTTKQHNYPLITSTTKYEKCVQICPTRTP